jgi:predicted ester cyclase
VALTREQMDRKLDEHFAYEAADDVEGVLATLTTDVVHDIVGSPSGPTIGPDAARTFYEGLFEDLADGRAQTIRRLYGDNFLVDESLWRGRAPGRPFGIEGHDRPLEFRLLHVLEFADDGRIKRENVWLDIAAIIAQLSQNDRQDAALAT